MQTSVGTVYVNAAFLEEVKDDNVALRELLHQTSKLLNSESRWNYTRRDISDLLQQLRDRLATHFTLEEAFGYLDDAISIAPRLSDKALALRNEHGDLYLKISSLAEVADSRRNSIDDQAKLIDDLRSFCRQLKRHEEDENELIMQALYDELGVGD